jgi:hypothetical protein
MLRTKASMHRISVWRWILDVKELHFPVRYQLMLANRVLLSEPDLRQPRLRFNLAHLQERG